MFIFLFPCTKLAAILRVVTYTFHLSPACSCYFRQGGYIYPQKSPFRSIPWTSGICENKRKRESVQKKTKPHRKSVTKFRKCGIRRTEVKNACKQGICLQWRTKNLSLWVYQSLVPAAFRGLLDTGFEAYCLLLNYYVMLNLFQHLKDGVRILLTCKFLNGKYKAGQGEAFQIYPLFTPYPVNNNIWNPGEKAIFPH